MKGAHVLIHQAAAVTDEQWQAAQPKPYAGEKPSAAASAALRGPKSKLDEQTGKVPNAIEGETLMHRESAGQVRPQDMANFDADRWSDQTQMWWTGGRPGDKLSFELPAFTGTVDLEIVLACAPDYAVVQLSLDDQPLGGPIDLYHPTVITTGVLSFPKQAVKGNKHSLNIEITGANPQAKQAFMVGLDYLRIRKSDGTFIAAAPSPARPRRAANLDPGVPAKAADGRILNLDFETGTLEDWTATGNAFEGQPLRGDLVSKRRRDMRSAHAGDYWIGSYELKGDPATGTLTSDPLVVSEPYASFLHNGGDHDQTRVELIRKDTGEVFYKMVGTDSETMRRVVVDLRGYLGKEIMIRLVDNHQGGWGHLNFDHFRLHADRPAAITVAPVALVQDEYPHAGLAAEKAAAAMKVPAGFTVTVGASEPDVKQPVAMALDDRGRVWIAEAYEYPIRAKGDQGRDRILIFEDTNGDATLDKKTVFAEGLNLVSGLEVGFGGVWVGAAPYLMFIPDRDGDDVPDGKPQILLDGWGYQDTHETLNTFIWGPDGWLYGCHGVFTHSRVGKPGTPDDQRTPINAGVWRYHPTKHLFEVFSHGTSNPWGVDFNDHGQAFITACVIPHLYHMVQGGRYQRQGGQHFNPYTYRDIPTIADHLHYLGANPHGGNSKSDQAGGGHAHAGAMIYLGDRWPAEYRNELFMNNIHGQRLNIDILKPNGSGYVGSHGPDFLLTGDQASQILNLRYGPDGDAWMIDWYDMQACHRVEADRHDRSNGRIYKISYNGSQERAPVVELAKLSDDELAALALHKNDWFVRHSRRLLQERAAERPISPEAVARLSEIATRNPDDTRRLRAAWALHVTRQLGGSLIQTLLADASPYVRGWAIQLTMELAGDKPEASLLDQFVRMAGEDESPVVRLYLASAAQRIPADQRWALLEALTTHAADATDHNLPLMYWYAAEPLADLDATRSLALAMSGGEAVPLLREFMLRRIGSSDAGSSLAVLVQGLQSAKTPALQLTFLQAIRAALKGQRQVSAPEGWSLASATLLKSDDEKVRLQATALGVTFGDAAAMNSMRSQIANDKADVDSRLVALQSLLDAKDASLVPTLLSLLASNGPLREAAIRGLAQYDDPSAAGALLSIYASLTPEQKQMALGTLSARSQSGIQLLKAIEGKQVASSDLTADLVRQLQFLKSDEVDALLNKVWGTVRDSAEDKLALIATYKQLVASRSHPEPSMELGRSVFSKTCMKCHVLYGVGFKIGPDLTGSNRADIDYLLSNIVDPSSVMAKEYLPTVVLTQDGRVISGLLKSEDARSLTIQTTDALVTVPLEEIEERTVGDKSMMPEDQLKQFSEHEVRSLIAYLRGMQQVPIKATPENASTLFNGKD
ncbi:MAG: PVC-type heme-binding CxxCH protein, partial [Planctomycetaceae bacterium]